MLKATLGVGLGARPTAGTPAIITGKDRGRGPERERSTTVTRVDTTGKCVHTHITVSYPCAYWECRISFSSAGGTETGYRTTS